MKGELNPADQILIQKYVKMARRAVAQRDPEQKPSSGTKTIQFNEGSTDTGYEALKWTYDPHAAMARLSDDTRDELFVREGIYTVNATTLPIIEEFNAIVGKSRRKSERHLAAPYRVLPDNR